MDNTIPKWQVLLRWVGFLPGAVLAALLASVALTLIDRLTLFLGGMNPDGFLNKLWLNVVPSAVIGVVFVLAGSRIAPSNRKAVAYVLALVTILTAGFLAYPAVVQHNWWALAGCMAMGIGAAVIAHSVATGELDLDERVLT